jgi:hypothetical protein
MPKEVPLQFSTNGVTLTVKHIITECHQFTDDLKKYNMPSNTEKQLVPDTGNTINFLIDTDLYDKI